MPLLFLLAGISTSLALKKRTVKEYVLERVKRLFIPFLFCTLLFMPIMTYIADKFNFGYEGNLFTHYSIFFTRFTDLTGADGGFSLGQFWFILYLFVISILALGIIVLLKKRTPKFKKDTSLWFICVLGLPLPLLSELLSIDGKSLAEYTYIFLVGYYIFSNDRIINKIEKFKWLFLFIGLCAVTLNVYLFIWSDTSYPLVNTAVKFTAEWFMLIALLGIGKGGVNFNSKVTLYMSQRSFAFYILHFVWVVLFQYLLADILFDNIELLYIVPVILAYCTTFLSCEICIRVPFLCLFMGIKSNTNYTCKNRQI